MSFKDTLVKDIDNVILNLNEFAENHTIIYDGVTYRDIPIVLIGIEEKERQASSSDHSQGLYLVTDRFYCNADVFCGLPEKGQTIKISDSRYKDYLNKYHIARSEINLGMVRVDMEAVNE